MKDSEAKFYHPKFETRAPRTGLYLRQLVDAVTDFKVSIITGCGAAAAVGAGVTQGNQNDFIVAAVLMVIAERSFTATKNMIAERKREENIFGIDLEDL